MVSADLWKCKTGEAMLDGENCGSCPTNAHFEVAVKNCVCDYGYKAVGETCVNPCDAGSTWTGEFCACPKNQARLDGKVCSECPAHAHFEAADAACACDYGWETTAGGKACEELKTAEVPTSPFDKSEKPKLICVNGEEWNGWVCDCPKGQAHLDGVNCGSCPVNSHFEVSVTSCVCDYGFEASGKDCAMKAIDTSASSYAAPTMESTAAPAAAPAAAAPAAAAPAAAAPAAAAPAAAAPAAAAPAAAAPAAASYDAPKSEAGAAGSASSDPSATATASNSGNTMTGSVNDNKITYTANAGNGAAKMDSLLKYENDGSALIESTHETAAHSGSLHALKTPATSHVTDFSMTAKDTSMTHSSMAGSGATNYEATYSSVDGFKSKSFEGEVKTAVAEGLLATHATKSYGKVEFTPLFSKITYEADGGLGSTIQRTTIESTVDGIKMFNDAKVFPFPVIISAPITPIDCFKGEIWNGYACACPANTFHIDGKDCGVCNVYSHFESKTKSCYCDDGHTMVAGVCTLKIEAPAAPAYTAPVVIAAPAAPAYTAPVVAPVAPVVAPAAPAYTAPVVAPAAPKPVAAATGY